MGIQEDSQDFGRGFAVICETLGEDLWGFMRLWERILEDLQGFTRIHKTLGEDSR